MGQSQQPNNQSTNRPIKTRSPTIHSQHTTNSTDQPTNQPTNQATKSANQSNRSHRIVSINTSCNQVDQPSDNKLKQNSITQTINQSTNQAIKSNQAKLHRIESTTQIGQSANQALSFNEFDHLSKRPTYKPSHTNQSNSQTIN